MSNYLDQITSLSDIKDFTLPQLKELNAEIREVIIQTTYNNGGHLASALGAVDCITALCSVYDFERDKLIFDVGHQSYAYKILARGKQNFATLRKEMGESGFPDSSIGDCFSGGHAGNSLSAGIGYATARDLIGEDYNVICFVGDASFFNGENLEAFFASEKKPKKFVIIFNDNGMSISENTNGAYKFFSKLALKKSYRKTKNILRKMFGNNAIGRFLRKIRSAFKRTLSPSSAMEEIGLKYYGAFDGHDVQLLKNVFSEIKNSENSAFIHIKTVKGKGFEDAEVCAEKFHGVSAGFENSVNTFSKEISSLLCELAKKDEKIVAITAGMKTGTGLTGFAESYPNKFFDVGICEEHAVTMASGMALGGLKPIVCIYSTFLQRSFDQVMVDVCMQKAPVVFLIDRAGFVGSDGQSHQGLFDLSYLRMMPNLTILAPKDVSELYQCLSYALALNAPVAIRYPNGINQPITQLNGNSKVSEWEVLTQGSKIVAFAVGPRAISLSLKVAKCFNGEMAVVNARSVKPLDCDLLQRYKDYSIVTIEENVLSGGFGEGVIGYYNSENLTVKIKTLAVKDEFILHSNVDRQLEGQGFTVEGLKSIIQGMICK